MNTTVLTWRHPCSYPAVVFNSDVQQGSQWLFQTPDLEPIGLAHLPEATTKVNGYCPGMNQQGRTREKQGHLELVSAGVESPCLIDGEHCSALQLSAPMPTNRAQKGLRASSSNQALEPRSWPCWGLQRGWSTELDRLPMCNRLAQTFHIKITAKTTRSDKPPFSSTHCSGGCNCLRGRRISFRSVGASGWLRLPGICEKGGQEQ